jgi:N-acetylneuraminate synthase/N,N'-diacetyllegionaminate synthase
MHATHSGHPPLCTPVVEIGYTRIGPTEPVFVIAEGGVNHNGDVRAAVELIDAARTTGADAVKFQIFSAEQLAAADAPVCHYQAGRHPQELSQREMLRRLELAPEDWTRLAEHAAAAGIQFLATPFGLSDLHVLTQLRPAAVKIASPDIVNVPLLAAAATTVLPMIVSTGAATLEEVDHAVQLIRRHRHQDRLILMHCVSAYPTPASDARLRCIQTLSARYQVPVGFSDHTADPEFSALAVAAGATVLEKHLTLSRQFEGPDHFFSLEPDQFASYVRAARDARRVLGTGVVAPTSREDEVRRLARGSIVVLRDIALGQVLLEKDLSVQRPSCGIEAQKWLDVVGRVATTDIPAGARLEWSMLSALPRVSLAEPPPISVAPIADSLS